MSVYKGIVLAGGSGSRLFPITKGVCKSLLPVYDKPLIYYPLSTLMLAEIREILVICNPQDKLAITNLLGTGKQWGLDIHYAMQKEPRGIAEAFIIAADFIGGSPVSLILGDNIFHGQSLGNLMRDATHNIDPFEKAIITTYEVADPKRYGVVGFGPEGISSIEEKPKDPKSNCAVTGLYFYPPDVVDVAKNLKPSARGELEITDVNSIYLAQNRISCMNMGRGSAWLDAGTFESLLDASNFVSTMEKRQGLRIACLEEIAIRQGYISMAHALNDSSPAHKYPNEYGEYVRKIISAKFPLP